MLFLKISLLKNQPLEVVYVRIGNPAFCLFLYLTGVDFRGELQHVGDVSEQKIKCWPIRTQEIGGIRLKDGLYAKSNLCKRNFDKFDSNELKEDCVKLIDLMKS